MITPNFQPWLLEINSSPSMARNTKATCALVDAVLEDTLKGKSTTPGAHVLFMQSTTVRFLKSTRCLHKTERITWCLLQWCWTGSKTRPPTPGALNCCTSSATFTIRRPSTSHSLSAAKRSRKPVAKPGGSSMWSLTSLGVIVVGRQPKHNKPPAKPPGSNQVNDVTVADIIVIHNGIKITKWLKSRKIAAR